MAYSAFKYGDPFVGSPRIAGSSIGWVSPFVGFKLNTQPSAMTPPLWPSMTFADGTVGRLYSEQFDLYPASSPTTFSIVSGSLPPGLALANLSNDIARIAGTPTTAGAYTFTIRASNSYGTADQSFTLTIGAAGSSGGAWISIT